MKRLFTILFGVITALIVVIANAMPVSAMSQVIIGGYADNLHQTTTEYNTLSSGHTWESSESYRKQCIPTGGAISRLFVELSAAPGDTKSHTLTLMVNGVASSLTVTITGAATTTGSDTTHSVDVVAGDVVSLRSTHDSSPDVSTARWSTVFSGTTSGESILLLTAYVNFRNTTVFVPVAHSTTGNTGTEDETYQIVPTNGVFKKLYVALSTDPGTAPDAYRLKLRVNGADSNDGSGNPLSVTITADNTTGNDTTHSIDVSASDYVNYVIDGLNSPNASLNMFAGVVFLADTDGESIILGQSSDTPTNTQTEYNYLTTTSYSNAWSTTELFQGGQAPTGNMVLSDFYVKMASAPGAGGSGDKWNFTIRGGGGDTTITVEILETATTGSDTSHTYTAIDYDDLGIKAVPTSSPTTSKVYWGLVCYIAGATYDISIDVNTEALGTVATSTTYYAKGSAPSNPVVDGDCTFAVTNNGSTCDLDMKMADFTGGVGWNIGAPGADQVRITAYYSGQDPSAGLVLTNSDQEFYDGLAASAHIHWDFKFESATSHTDGVAKSGVLTITAVAED